MTPSFRQRALDIGHERARFLRTRYGEELRLARVGAGLTQSGLGRSAGVSQAFVSAVELGARTATLDIACRLAAGAGCELSLRLFPGRGVSLRDSGQLAMAEALVAVADPSWHAQLEVPVSSSDRRAADLVLEGHREVLHIEIERRLVDLQAQLRSATLKRDALAARHKRPVRLILVIPDRRSSRQLVADLASLLARTMPITSRRIRHCLITGDSVGGDGILFWPMAGPRRPGLTT